MASDETVLNISNAIITVLPSVVSLIQALFKKQNPNLPIPTSAEILSAFADVCTQSLAKDDEWLANHPT